MDAAARKKALETVSRVLEMARSTPPKVWAPSRDQRVKIRWTGELVARFKARRHGARTTRRSPLSLACRTTAPVPCRQLGRVISCVLLQPGQLQQGGKFGRWRPFSPRRPKRVLAPRGGLCRRAGFAGCDLSPMQRIGSIFGPLPLQCTPEGAGPRSS